MRTRVMLVAMLLALAPAAHSEAPAPAGREDPDSGREMLGVIPPAFAFDRWARGAPQTLASLRGRVVLVRWWADECHFCSSTLPAIEQLRQEHARDGLEVIAVYHPKEPHHVRDRVIVRAAEQLGFHGPIAVDERWHTLDRWWLDGHPERNWTSVSFLLDRAGRVQWVHGGGEYHPSDDPRHARCDRQWHELQHAVDAALAAPAGS
jgi:thiol-disulfide isomerase/thioredoxin